MSSTSYTCQVNGYAPSYQNQSSGVYGQSDYTSTPTIANTGGHQQWSIRTTPSTIVSNGCSVLNSSHFVSNCKSYASFGRHR